jgi:Fe2+ or Zn2+ uptake regulation protein
VRPKSFPHHFPEVMHAPSEEELTADILGYMLEHPNALDEAHGIVAWWFSGERMLVGLATVERILRHLVSEGMVVAHAIPGGRTLYSLNKDRKDDIARLIGREPQ